jgi:lipid II:glycine glycyltransferase (peptidoglycan interpeptide bridge formation enzyme)
MPFTRFGAFYLYGASADKIEVTGAMNYLHWQSILQMKEKGVKRYDFAGARLSDVSGTRLEGIQQFKARFGSALDEGFLWKKDLSYMPCHLFDNLLSFKLKLKRQKVPKDIIDQEKMRIHA